MRHLKYLLTGVLFYTVLFGLVGLVVLTDYGLLVIGGVALVVLCYIMGLALHNGE